MATVNDIIKLHRDFFYGVADVRSRIMPVEGTCFAQIRAKNNAICERALKALKPVMAYINKQTYMVNGYTDTLSAYDMYEIMVKLQNDSVTAMDKVIDAKDAGNEEEVQRLRDVLNGHRAKTEAFMNLEAIPV